MKKWKLITVLIWTCFILYQGSQTLDDSLNQSNMIVDWIVEQIESYQVTKKVSQQPVGEEVASQQSEQPTSKSNLHQQISLLIRKLAHFIEYFILAILVFLLLRDSTVKTKDIVIYTLFFVLCIAVIDEFIQSFVGRGSNVRDVVIDFSGGIMGIGLIQFIQYRRRKKLAK